jgi:hypothetical protein
MARFVSPVLFVLTLAGRTMFAQTPCPSGPPAFELFRQDEDYRYLSNSACNSHYWDRLKYVQLGSNADTFFTLGGEIREWYEGYRNANWGSGPQDKQGYGGIHGAGTDRVRHLLTACYSFWECVDLMAEDVVKTGRVISVLAALDRGQTVRALLNELYEVMVGAAGESEYTSDRFEAKVLRKRIRHFEVVVKRSSASFLS